MILSAKIIALTFLSLPFSVNLSIFAYKKAAYESHTPYGWQN
jgi:hypothetical protein